MKKHCIALIVALVAFSTVHAEVITPSQAVSIAEEFLGESLAPQRAQGINRTAPDRENAPFYVVSRGEGKGYVLVSGDDCLPQVLGYTDAGDFDMDNMSPAYKDMIDWITNAVNEGQQTGAPAHAVRKAAADRVTINPLIKSHWHQDAPYNNFCPICSDNGKHAVVGCVATATSQVIYYFRKDLPGKLLATTPTYKGGNEQCDVTVSYPKGTPIEYDLMFDSYTNSEPSDFKNAVALLCYTVGTTSKMGYWHSSGAYISEANRAMKSHFGLYGTNLSRNNMSIDDWESIIYSSLAAQKPLVYSGFTPDGSSGHAINLDGYNAKNGLWHFNFGWGGSGDGWYTLDLETGVNGFPMWQEIVYNITPLTPNLAAKVVSGDTFYRRVYNTASVAITNNGTVPVSGFNLFLQTTDKKPSSSNTPAATSKNEFVAPGETVVIDMEFKPALAREYYLYITDANRNVLTSKPITVVEPDAQFDVYGMTASASTDTVMVGDQSFDVLYNKSVTVAADVVNTGTTPGLPSVKFVLYKWNAETGEEKSLKSKTISDQVIKNGERKTISNTFTSLTAGSYIVGRVTSSDGTLVTADTLVRFFVKESDLQIDTLVNGTAVLSGGWDGDAFATLANDPAVTAYDLRGVSGVNGSLAAANPNALFYVDVPLHGANIIINGQCEDLQLTAGYSFRPAEPFTAAKAQYMPDMVPGTYYSLVLPFAAAKPDGYVARFITGFSKSYFGAAEMVDNLEAATPYFISTDTYAPAPFTASNVTVCVACDTTHTKPFVGTFTSDPLYEQRLDPSHFMLALDLEAGTGTQYYANQDAAYTPVPFTAMLSSEVKKVRASVDDSLEKSYKKLAVAIADARALYDEKHAIVADSTNEQMLTLIDEAHTYWSTLADSTYGNVTKFTKNIDTFCETYPLHIGYSPEPVDFTAFITNPSFETNTKTGWKGDTHSIIRSASTINTFVAHANGKFYLHNNSSGASTQISQVVTGLQPGYYRLTAMVGTEADGHVNLFAGDSVYAAPASELGKYYLTEAAIDSVWVDGGELTIGIQAGETWYKCDNFQLFFLGDGTVPTAIQPVTVEEPSFQPGIFDLSGRRIGSADDMLPGVIYIVNGRKVMRIEE